MSSLLPSDHSEFNTKEYWNRFFEQRNRTAFEWYGTFGDILPGILPIIRKTDSILVIGCGNSNFSSELYDLGYENIVNLDFSELVIEEMREKNINRPNMRWEVGDMTNMEAYSENSFNVVVDKGALDALLSKDIPELKQQARQMFSEVSRVLNSQGYYLCISLAEDFVLSTLLGFYVDASTHWKVDVWPIFTATRSPFMPLLFSIKNQDTGSQRLSVHVTTTAQKASPGLLMDSLQAGMHLASLQQYLSMSYRIGTLQPGRFEVIHLYAQRPIDDTHASIPRFTIYIVDVSEQAEHSCVVFIVPLGRESEYQFTSKNGLVDLAFQAKTKRLISVCCNRPHTFPESAQLQAELSPIMMTLKPANMPSTEQIPYLGVGQDESWELLDEGCSDMSGKYIVEEREHEASGGVVRRLIFLQNQQLVQTEARLLRSKRPGGGGSKGKGGNKKGKATGKKNTADSEESLVFDYNFVDDHHRGMLAALTLSPSLALAAAQGNPSSPPCRSALVVGLGGGSLVMCMQRLLPQIQVTACEIDASVHTVAEKFFAFAPRKNTSVVIADGLRFVDSQWSASPRPVYDLILVDVDSKDLTKGLSAPPRPFVQELFLQQSHEMLSAEGMLVINVAARSSETFQEIVELVARLFGGRDHVFALQPSRETVNVQLIALKTVVASTEGAAQKKKDQASSRPSIQWARTLDAWLRANGQPDFLEMSELVDKIVPVSSFSHSS